MKRALAALKENYQLVFPAMLVVVALAGMTGYLPASLVDPVRYYAALMVVVGVPSAMMTWFVIHPFAQALRRAGPGRAYTVVILAVAPVAGVIWWSRRWLLAVDFGTNYVLMVMAVIPFAVATTIAAGYRKHLTMPIQAGIAELTARPGRLLTEGIYGRIRHPRYLESILWIVGYAAFTNYLAVYLTALLLVPVVHVVVLMEEKELAKRFGPPYAEYCRRVPRYLPRVP